MNRRLVLYDFDGTLTTKDTFLEFIKFHHGVARYVAGFAVLSPWLILFKAGLIRNDKAKQLVLRFFFANTPEELFNDSCLRFARTVIPTLLRPRATDLIQKEKAAGSTLVVVSASPENWVRPWCEQNELQCIGTRLEVRDNRITGNISGENCFGMEKAVRIRKKFSLTEFSSIAAYGDSKGDIEMLALANEPHWREL